MTNVLDPESIHTILRNLMRPCQIRELVKENKLYYYQKMMKLKMEIN
jgi:hypothetical protein